MSTSAVKPIPEGMHTLTPHIVVDGAAAAIDFYKKAFGATERLRLPAPGGKLMHAQIQIGDSALMLVDEFPEMQTFGAKTLKGSPVVLHLFVSDVDATLSQAVAAGGTLKMPAADMFWGDRYGQIQDPFGHVWSVATHKQDLTPEEIQKNMEKMGMGGC